MTKFKRNRVWIVSYVFNNECHAMRVHAKSKDEATSQAKSILGDANVVIESVILV